MYRIVVDGATHPIHDDPKGVQVFVRDEGTGETAEVRVEFDGKELVIALAGAVRIRETREAVIARVGLTL